MKIKSLDNLYFKLDKHILLAEAYTEISKLSNIIKMCRLKPHSLFNNKDFKLILHNWWVDEFGNSLKITPNKKVKLTFNDLSISTTIICTDLYYGLPLNKIVKISKLAYICIGHDEDLYKENAIISLLGIDNYLRTYMYMYGEWKQVSPLLIGFENLQLLSANCDMRYFRELTIKKNMPLPCVSATQWLTSIPVNKIFMSIVGRKYDDFFDFLIKDI